jgi:ankyrin repeat protein
VCGGLLRSTPLHEAVKFGSLVNAQLFLDTGAEVDNADSLQRTPLFYASRAGNSEMVDLLLKFHADATRSDWYDNSPLHEASWMGHMLVVEALLKHSSKITGMNAQGLSALSLSLQASMVDISVALLDAGATLSPSDTPDVLRTKSTPLLQAIVQRHDKELDTKDVTVENDDNKLLIHRLSASRDILDQKLLRELLVCGLSINNQSPSGNNTLCWTVANYLRPARPASASPYASSNPYAINPAKAGVTYVHRNVFPPKTGPPARFLEGAWVLLDHGALCGQTTGTTCLHYLANFDYTDDMAALVRRLIDVGCELEVQAETPDKQTPFLRAVSSRNSN